jgi:hypothetical protein
MNRIVKKNINILKIIFSDAPSFVGANNAALIVHDEEQEDFTRLEVEKKRHRTYGIHRNKQLSAYGNNQWPRLKITF